MHGSEHFGAVKKSSSSSSPIPSPIFADIAQQSIHQNPITHIHHHPLNLLKCGTPRTFSPPIYLFSLSLLQPTIINSFSLLQQPSHLFIDPSPSILFLHSQPTVVFVYPNSLTLQMPLFLMIMALLNSRPPFLRPLITLPLFKLLPVFFLQGPSPSSSFVPSAAVLSGSKSWYCLLHFFQAYLIFCFFSLETNWGLLIFFSCYVFEEILQKGFLELVSNSLNG